MKGIRKVVVFVVIVLLLAGGAYLYHAKSIDNLEIKMREAQEQKDLLEKRMSEIQDKLSQSEEEKQSLLNKIDDLLTEDVYYFDSAAMAEEVKNIGELASIEYRYTNVGTLDASKKLFTTEFKIPGTRKTVVITMDGILKIGVDVDDIRITSNEETKTITVVMPKPKMISNELNEDSLMVYDESSGIFSKVSLADGSSVRSQIKTKAEQNAKDNGVYEQATKNAEDIIRCMMEAIPGLKDNYTIVFK